MVCSFNAAPRLETPPRPEDGVATGMRSRIRRRERLVRSFGRQRGGRASGWNREGSWGEGKRGMEHLWRDSRRGGTAPPARESGAPLARECQATVVFPDREFQLSRATGSIVAAATGASPALGLPVSAPPATARQDHGVVVVLFVRGYPCPGPRAMVCREACVQRRRQDGRAAVKTGAETLTCRGRACRCRPKRDKANRMTLALPVADGATGYWCFPQFFQEAGGARLGGREAGRLEISSNFFPAGVGSGIVAVRRVARRISASGLFAGSAVFHGCRDGPPAMPVAMPGFRGEAFF